MWMWTPHVYYLDSTSVLRRSQIGDHRQGTVVAPINSSPVHALDLCRAFESALPSPVDYHRMGVVLLLLSVYRFCCCCCYPPSPLSPRRLMAILLSSATLSQVAMLALPLLLSCRCLVYTCLLQGHLLLAVFPASLVFPTAVDNNNSSSHLNWLALRPSVPWF